MRFGLLRRFSTFESPASARRLNQLPENRILMVAADRREWMTNAVGSLQTNFQQILPRSRQIPQVQTGDLPYRTVLAVSVFSLRHSIAQFASFDRIRTIATGDSIVAGGVA